MATVLTLYLGLTSVASPLIRLVLSRRRAAGKEDAGRLPERMGHASHPRPEGRLVWFHAASVGESLSALPLVEKLRRDEPDISVLVTSGTVTSAHLLAERLPAEALHQFVPVDVRGAVDRFLDHWRPDVAAWIESEVWPRMLTSVARRRIPALLLNARLSERSRRRWRRLGGSARAIFGVFAYVQAQDDATAAALAELGVAKDRLCLAPSFKEAAAPLPFDAGEADHLRAAMTGRLVWTAASTHPGEERLALDAHRRVLAHQPRALLILVPRHPERGPELAALLDASGLVWTRRRFGPPASSSQVYLADTLGELGLWYRLAQVAFVGGSTGGIGGHNPYEPARLGIPILHGPDTANFGEAYRTLDAAAAARVVRSPETLGVAILELAGTVGGEAMADKAARALGGGQESLVRALDAIRASLAG